MVVTGFFVLCILCNMLTQRACGHIGVIENNHGKHFACCTLSLHVTISLTVSALHLLGNRCLLPTAICPSSDVHIDKTSVSCDKTVT